MGTRRDSAESSGSIRCNDVAIDSSRYRDAAGTRHGQSLTTFLGQPLPILMSSIVLALTGLPGTGKTTLADALYPLLPGFAFVDVDTLTIPLVRTALELRGLTLEAASESGELRRLRDAQYECLFAQTRQLVGFGRDVLMVGSMSNELADPQRFRQVVGGFAPAAFLLVRTHAPAPVVCVRLEQRAGYWDPLRLKRWDLDAPRYGAPAPLPMPGLEVDTTGASPAELARRVLAWVGRVAPRLQQHAGAVPQGWSGARVPAAAPARLGGAPRPSNLPNREH
jgi:predicted kinase